jgi:hypothetical protein
MAPGTFAFPLSHSFQEEEFTHNWERLRAVLEDAPQKLTRKQVLERWPADFPVPDASTLWRWLERAVGQRLVLRQGAGRSNDPYRYWLLGMEEEWRRDPLALPALESFRQARDLFQNKKRRPSEEE